MSSFFVVVLCVFSVIVVLQFVLLRLVLPQRLSKTTRIVISSVVTLGLNTIPFLYLLSGVIFDEQPWWHRELVIFPYAILMVTSALSGTILLIVWLVSSTLFRRNRRFDSSKRQLLTNSSRILTGASLTVLAYGAYRENRTLDVSKIVLPYTGLHPDLQGLRLVHLTDIHAGPFISSDTIAEIVNRANGLKPDLIVMTGDYINHNPNYIDGCLQILDELKAPAGVLGVYGNHDYYTGIRAMREAFGKTQISMLSDTHGVAKGLEGLLNIIGADDPVSGWATDAPFRNLTQVSRLLLPERFNLLLSHRPGIFRICQEWNVDLTVAGHTHGGQVIIPGVGSRGLSLAGPFLSYTHGLYEAEQNPEVRMYLSRGLGTIVAPVRLFCKPEIVEITLVEA
jgi:predicted MPP superfamily phosphohydrolase